MKVCPNCSASYGDDADICASDGTRLMERGALDGPGLGTILGQYRLLDVLGKGAMGTVYLGEHIRLGRKVAVKFMRPDIAANPRQSARFFAEARAVNRISHANLVQITDFFDEEGQDKYYIMEHLQGRTLRERLAEDGVMPLQRSLAIAIQTFNALGAVHTAGIVHRDIKPDNVFLAHIGDQVDHVKILDFGVAKLTDMEGMSLADTADGAILGTPRYMSPEQVSGKAIDHRTDIYSMGVLLFELSTGRRPYEAESFGEMVVKHMAVAPPKPSSLPGLPHQIPTVLEEMILQCMAKDPDERPASAHDVAEKLRELHDQLANADEAELRRMSKKPTTLPQVLVFALPVLLLAVIGGAWAFMRPSPSELAAAAPQVGAISPPKPTHVSLTFKSDPSGAEILTESGTDPLGITPMSHRVPVAATPETYVFRLKGFQEVRQIVTHERDADVSVSLLPALPKAEKPPPSRTPRPRKIRRTEAKVKRRGTIDPFQ